MRIYAHFLNFGGNLDYSYDSISDSSSSLEDSTEVELNPFLKTLNLEKFRP